MTPNPDARLRTIADLLTKDPASYRGYGWLWWGLKDVLKRVYSEDDLSLLGEHSNAAAVRLARATYPDVGDLVNAAIDRYTERAQYAQLYAADDHYPDGAPLRITDPDAGFANARRTPY